MDGDLARQHDLTSPCAAERYTGRPPPVNVPDWPGGGVRSARRVTERMWNSRSAVDSSSDAAETTSGGRGPDTPVPAGCPWSTKDAIKIPPAADMTATSGTLIATRGRRRRILGTGETLFSGAASGASRSSFVNSATEMANAWHEAQRSRCLESRRSSNPERAWSGARAARTRACSHDSGRSHVIRFQTSGWRVS